MQVKRINCIIVSMVTQTPITYLFHQFTGNWRICATEYIGHITWSF